jgi:hypothetical protein
MRIEHDNTMLWFPHGSGCQAKETGALTRG